MNTQSNNMERDEKDRIAEAAGAWDARLRAPDCTSDDREHFAAWRAVNPAHGEEFERLQAIVSGLRKARSRADLRSIRDGALASVERRQQRIKQAIAASVAALGLAVLLWAAAPRIAGFNWNPADNYVTDIGQRSTYALQDGSILELNSKTHVQVRFSSARRSVKLLEGQAIFHVAKDARRPFVVQAGEREIVAVGTAFDVRVDPSTMRVTLLEGKVAVRPEASAAAFELPLSVASAEKHSGEQTASAERSDSAHADSETLRAAGFETVFLSPGQQLIAARITEEHPLGSAPGNILVRDVKVDQVTSWRDGSVFLEDLTLAQAAAEMNKHSVVQIVVDADPALTDLRINGMFKAGEQQVFTHALEEYFPIVAEQRGETRIVLRYRH